MTDQPVHDAWDRALERYRGLPVPAATFNVALLEALRPRWAARIRPDTSMFDLLFTALDSTGYSYDERVEVSYESDIRVRMALRRMASRRGETRPAGPVVVTGDYTRPENALPAVESLLMQLTPQ